MKKTSAKMRLTHIIHAPGFGNTESPAAAKGYGKPMPAPSTNGKATAQTRPAANHLAVKSNVAIRIGSTQAPASVAAPNPST